METSSSSLIIIEMMEEIRRREPPHIKADLRSLDFTVNRVLMKLFRTSNIEIVQDCRMFVKFKLPSEILTLRYNKFISNQHAFASLHN